MSNKSDIYSALENTETVRLDDNIYLIIGKNKGTFPYCNALLIVDDDVVLIDSGCGSEVLSPFKEYVDILINSHYHIDHILGNALFDELWVTEEEAGATESFERYRQYAGIYGKPVEKEWLSWFHDWFEFSPSQHTRTFKGNETFDFGATRWQVVHTPGHSPGHCCFYEPDKRILFSSDIDLAGFGPWYGTSNANLDDFIESIKMIRGYDIKTIATSHTFPLKSGIEEALDRYLNIIFEREEVILSCLRKGFTAESIIDQDIMYRQEQKRYKAFVWFEKNMIDKHIHRLVTAGKVEKMDSTYNVL